MHMHLHLPVCVCAFSLLVCQSGMKTDFERIDQNSHKPEILGFFNQEPYKSPSKKQNDVQFYGILPLQIIYRNAKKKSGAAMLKQRDKETNTKALTPNVEVKT